MTQQTGIDAATLGQALAHVEALPLGDAVILHNRESGAIVGSNAFGAVLIDCLRADPAPDAAVCEVAKALDTPEQDVREAVEGTLASWAADGLFLTDLQPFLNPIAYRPAEAGDVRHILLGARSLGLQSEDPELLADIERALAPMDLQSTTARAPAAVRLEAIREGQGYGVFRDGQPIWGTAAYELTRFHLLREIMDILCGPDRVAAHLHASAIALGEGGLIFAGASGSGKSSLATLLLGAGAALASDDHVAIDITGDAFLAFPTRPNLKSGARDLPEVRKIVAAQGEAMAPDANTAAFVPKARVPVGTAVALAGLVFPVYDPECENELTIVAPDDALRELIQTGSRVSRSTRSIAPLVHMLRAHPSCLLRYRDTEFAVSSCLDLLDR